MKTTLCTLAIAAVLLPRYADAQPSCGDTIGKGETVTLTADVGPCDGFSDSEAVFIVDGGTLDLGGRTVTCADTNLDDDVPQGIVLFGKKSKVMNGTVVNCMNAFGVAGTGKHLVQGVTAQGSLDDGYDITEGSNKNKFIDITGNGNASDGMQIDGDKNKIVNAVMTGNGEDGIDMSSSADKNKLTSPRVENNGDSGIEIGGDKNKLKAPTVSGNTAFGVNFGGAKNKITGGSSQGNGDLDVVDCEGNKLKGFTFTTSSPDCQ